MSDLKLYLFGEDILRRETEPVEDIDDELLRFAEGMQELMRSIKGVGLAANQTGLNRRFFVMHPSLLPPGSDEVFINPEIIDSSAETVRDEEGCLSFLSVCSDVSRSVNLTLQYTDAEGNEKLLEAEGLLARAIQHEIDHLDGILFIDHLSRIKRRLVTQKFNRKIKEIQEEGESSDR
ncbi:MAG: peptide deformylase [bacterium]|nr:peptide deformylase [bacterium]